MCIQPFKIHRFSNNSTLDDSTQENDTFRRIQLLSLGTQSVVYFDISHFDDDVRMIPRSLINLGIFAHLVGKILSTRIAYLVSTVILHEDEEVNMTYTDVRLVCSLVYDNLTSSIYSHIVRLNLSVCVICGCTSISIVNDAGIVILSRMSCSFGNNRFLQKTVRPTSNMFSWRTRGKKKRLEHISTRYSR